MGTTRTPIRKMYEACKACKENCSGYGTCKRGFENWYSRRTKDNGCPLVRRQRTTCKRCEHRIVMPAFSEGICSRCGARIVSSNTPCDRLCEPMRYKTGPVRKVWVADQLDKTKGPEPKLRVFLVSRSRNERR